MCLKNSKDLLALTLSNNIYKIIGIPFWTRLIDMRQHKIKHLIEFIQFAQLNSKIQLILMMCSKNKDQQIFHFCIFTKYGYCD